HGKGSKVVHVGRLKPVFARPEYREHWKMTKSPGDVVHENVFVPEQHRRPQNAVRQAGFNERAFEPRLVSKIFQWGMFIRVGDAHMDNTTDVGALCGIE